MKKEGIKRFINKYFFVLGIIFLFSLNYVFADTLPIHIRPLDGTGSVQANTNFDYQFNFTSNYDCSTILHSVTKTISTDKYGLGFTEIDITPLNDTPSYLCEYRALTGNALSLRQVHNISSGIFNRSLGKNIKYDELNLTGNLTLGQKITFSLGSVFKEITGWFVINKAVSIEGDLNVTGNINVTGIVNASTVYSGGHNVSVWMYNQSDGSYNVSYANYAYNMSDGSYNISYDTWAYNQTYTEGTYNITYDSNPGNTSFNETRTNLLYSLIWWGYNMTSSVFPFIDTASNNLQNNITDLNTTYNQYWYNMSDGSYNATYADYAYNMSVGDNLILSGGNGNLTAYNISINNNLTVKGKSSFNNNIKVIGKIELNTSTGNGVDTYIYNNNLISNYAFTMFYPSSGTGVSQKMIVSPKGTGATSENRAGMVVFNTDFSADGTNYEFAELRASGTYFQFFTGKSGNGIVRPLQLSASNTGLSVPQLYLATTEKVGIGTDNPGEKLHVNGNIKIGTSVAGTDYYLFFDGESNDGYIQWLEDEDKFKILDTVNITGNLEVSGNLNVTGCIQYNGGTLGTCV